MCFPNGSAHCLLFIICQREHEPRQWSETSGMTFTCSEHRVANLAQANMWYTLQLLRLHFLPVVCMSSTSSQYCKGQSCWLKGKRVACYRFAGLEIRALGLALKRHFLRITPTTCMTIILLSGTLREVNSCKINQRFHKRVFPGIWFAVVACSLILWRLPWLMRIDVL